MFQIYGKRKNVPIHQPGNHLVVSHVKKSRREREKTGVKAPTLRLRGTLQIPKWCRVFFSLFTAPKIDKFFDVTTPKRQGTFIVPEARRTYWTRSFRRKFGRTTGTNMGDPRMYAKSRDRWTMLKIEKSETLPSLVYLDISSAYLRQISTGWWF